MLNNTPASLRLLASVPLCILTSCVLFGGRKVHVDIASDPAGAEVFLIPQIKWDNNGKTALLRDPKFLDNYRVGGSQVTPFEAQVGYHEQVLAMRVAGLFAWKEVRPDDGDTLFLQGFIALNE